jgi:SAM-dependent methyltransferase
MLMRNDNKMTTARIERNAAPASPWGRRLYDYARAHLNLDVELRYRAVARLIRSELQQGTRILETGAGAVSIGGYLGCRSMAVDTTFDTECNKHTDRVQASVVRLPFPDKSWDIVVSIDMLEHIPPDCRTQALREMIRVTRRMLVLAVPVGEAAFQQDIELHDYYIAKHGEPHRFTREHVEFGLPKLAETSESLATAAERTGRKLHLDVRPNLNIGFRSSFMKLALHKSFLARAMYVAMFPLALLGPVFDQGICYRTIFLARLEEENPLDRRHCRIGEECRA